MKKVKQLIIYILLMAMMSSLIVYGATPTTAKEYFEAAQSARHANKLEEAIKNFDLALKLDPKYNLCYILKAYSLSDLNKPEEALACIETAISQNPDILANFAYKGKYLTDLGRFEEAIEAFKIGIEHSGTLFYDQLAFAYLNLDDIENCLKALRTYIINYSLLKDYIDEMFFTKLGENPTFIEIMGERRDEMMGKFKNTYELCQKPFDDITFLDASTGFSEAEQQEITQINARFQTNLMNGNIYNEKTALSYGISSLSPYKGALVYAGRLMKKLMLLGFKGSYTPVGSKVLYAGRTNGILKAAIISEKGKTDFPGIYTSQNEDFYVYVKNNGVWELYTALVPKTKE